MLSYVQPRVISKLPIGSNDFAVHLKQYGFGIDRRVIEAVERLNQWQNKRDPLQRVVRVVRISPSRMRSLFRSSLGMSPIGYLRRARLCSAAKVLGSSFLSIKEVAVRVGYGDVSHFVRDFKARYGDTPTAYRQKVLRNTSATIE